jgi:hypothetical protein
MELDLESSVLKFFEGSESSDNALTKELTDDIILMEMDERNVDE